MLIQGAIKGTGSKQGRAEIEFTTTQTDTTYTVTVAFFCRTILKCSDSSNTFKWDWDSSPDTSLGSKSIKHTSSVEWDLANRTKVATKTKTFSRGTSYVNKTVSFRFSGVDVVGNGANCPVSYTFEVPSRPQYTVTFDANGGENAPSPQVKNLGRTLYVTSDIPTREGYDFIGWSKVRNSVDVDYNEGEAFNETGDTTLYAVWKKDLTLSFVGNGGTNPETQNRTIYNDITSFAFALPTPTREGWTFIGWANSPSEHTGVTGSITISDDTVLYAVWKKNLTLSFNKNGGSGNISSITHTIYNSDVGSYFTIPSNTLTKANYQFDGWMLGNQLVNNGAEIFLKENTTLVASFSKVAQWSVPSDVVKAFCKVDGRWVEVAQVWTRNGNWKRANILPKFNIGGE